MLALCIQYACATLQSLMYWCKASWTWACRVVFQTRRTRSTSGFRSVTVRATRWGRPPILLLPSTSRRLSWFPRADRRGTRAGPLPTYSPNLSTSSLQKCTSSSAARRYTHGAQMPSEFHQRHRYGWRLFTIKHNLCIMRLSKTC